MLIFFAVVAVLILVSLFFPTGVVHERHHKTMNTFIKLRNIVSAALAYQAYYEEWPATLSELHHNRSNMVFINWGQAGAKDDWGHPIEFHPYTPSRGYGRVVSLGRDGRPGGEGLNADLEETFGRKR